MEEDFGKKLKRFQAARIAGQWHLELQAYQPFCPCKKPPGFLRAVSIFRLDNSSVLSG